MPQIGYAAIPPPPLPPLQPLGNRQVISATRDISVVPTKCQIDECLWARDYAELQKACYLARVCQFRPPHKCRYYKVADILQDGPTCGLTALSMFLNGVPTTQQLLSVARRRRYTNNGEMFSTLYLFQLICDYLPKQSGVAGVAVDSNLQDNANCQHAMQFDCQLHQGHLNCDKVREWLRAGACLFVPYPFTTEKGVM